MKVAAAGVSTLC